MPDDYRVVLEGAIRVAEVDSPDEAVSVAIAKSGEQLNPELGYVTIRTSQRSCPDCDGSQDAAFVAAGDALVTLDFELTVFDAEDESHAENVARADLGEELEDVPLSVKSVEVVEGAADANTDETDAENEDHPDSNVAPEFEDSVPA